MIQDSVPSLCDVGPECDRKHQHGKNENPRRGTLRLVHLRRLTKKREKSQEKSHASSMLPIAMRNASTTRTRCTRKAAASKAHVVV
ncbi:hypothetical protein V8C37DRAFT_385501 [Trichoderma ceciliae]